jgi:phosphoglycolate phosphatase-like HAD superfamily hydrolase
VKVLVFDIDGVLIDVRPSFYRIIHELSGATFDDIRKFKDNGGFNDDWELARAAHSWVKAGKPPIFGRVENWRDVVEQCGHDPGDLSERCKALYRQNYWRDEKPLLERPILESLARSARICACTGRDRWEFDRAEELLRFTFHASSTMEDIRKPAPEALLRLLPENASEVTMFGDSEDDRRTIENARPRTSAVLRYYHVADTPGALLKLLREEHYV